uniref:Nicotinic acetylcholine receptor alpha 4 subunit n=2 Tax=Nilaparvata lugens TaxID=108931 RepID=Q6U4B9_NILLU|nr:nicotinic acetylcholine receptor alpha 4 subunit [Nilaparvata lugens]
MTTNYKRLIRPVNVSDRNHTQQSRGKMGLRLQLINLKNQINVWVWNDTKFGWQSDKGNNDDYGGVLHVPWLPDIVLNNADGVTIMTKANNTLHHTGGVWDPPAIFGSFCEIDVFPFDQKCMKFGSWTYNGEQGHVDARHMHNSPDSWTISPEFIDLQDCVGLSVEWDITWYVPSVEWDEVYSCCGEEYPIIFNIGMRRKTLFYTVNLIPCVISGLLVFLPSDEKVSLLDISILLSFGLLDAIIPGTSLPLLGKLFTMVLLSVVVTLNVNFRTHRMRPWFIQMLPLLMERPKKDDDEEDEASGNPDGEGVHLDSETPPDVDLGLGGGGGGGGGLSLGGSVGGWSSKTASSADYEDDKYELPLALPADDSAFGDQGLPPLPSSLPAAADDDLFGAANSKCPAAAAAAAALHPHDVSPSFDSNKPSHEMEKTIEDGNNSDHHLFIAQHVKNKDKFESQQHNNDESVEEDWGQYVAMDQQLRLFLWIFTIACWMGTFFQWSIILQAGHNNDSSLYDTTSPVDSSQSDIRPIDIKFQKIAIAKKKFMLLLGTSSEPHHHLPEEG